MAMRLYNQTASHRRFRMAALDQLAADFDSMGGNMSMPTIVRIKSDVEKGDSTTFMNDDVYEYRRSSLCRSLSHGTEGT